jgi:threonine aldolase
MIDLRSDTVTLPSPAMRRAMADADLGDDVYGEDPTVNRLEAVAAAMLGKEASVFVPTGTMGNLASLLAHAGRGSEVILGDESHIFHYEAGGASALGGLVYHTVPTLADGTLPLEAIDAAVRPAHRDYHAAPAGVICLENTHNRRGGVILTPEYFARVAEVAARHHLPIHLDGARLYNAVVATGLPVTAWTQHVTTVQCCLSKGLAAPAGSIIAGPAPVVDRARRYRKILGGGMRQAGVLAAAGLVALDGMIERLAEDHANARALAEALHDASTLPVDPARVQTNIMVFRLPDAGQAETYRAALRQDGVLVSHMGGGLIRAVTHYGITAEDCRVAAACMARAAEAVRTSA